MGCASRISRVCPLGYICLALDFEPAGYAYCPDAAAAYRSGLLCFGPACRKDLPGAPHLVGYSSDLLLYSYTAVRVRRRFGYLSFAWYVSRRGVGGLDSRLLGVLVLVGAFWLTSSLTAAPLAAYFLNNPDQIMSRVATESIFEAESGQLLVFGQNAISTLGMLSFQGDPNSRHNFPGRPVLDPVLSVFGLLGFCLVVARIRRPRIGLGVIVAGDDALT